MTLDLLARPYACEHQTWLSAALEPTTSSDSQFRGAWRNSNLYDAAKSQAGNVTTVVRETQLRFGFFLIEGDG